MNYVNVLIVFNKCQLSLLFIGDFTLETQFYLIKPTIWLLFYICSAEKDAFYLQCATAHENRSNQTSRGICTRFTCYFHATELS